MGPIKVPPGLGAVRWCTPIQGNWKKGDEVEELTSGVAAKEVVYSTMIRATHEEHCLEAASEDQVAFFLQNHPSRTKLDLVEAGAQERLNDRLNRYII